MGWLGKTTYDVLFAIHLKTRQVKILGVTEHSNADYMTGSTGISVGMFHVANWRDPSIRSARRIIPLQAGIRLHPAPPPKRSAALPPRRCLNSMN